MEDLFFAADTCRQWLGFAQTEGSVRVKDRFKEELQATTIDLSRTIQRVQQVLDGVPFRNRCFGQITETTIDPLSLPSGILPHLQRCEQRIHRALAGSWRICLWLHKSPVGWGAPFNRHF